MGTIRSRDLAPHARWVKPGNPFEDLVDGEQGDAMSKHLDVCPECQGPMHPTDGPSGFVYGHSRGGWSCVMRQLANEREENKRLRDALRPFANYYRAQKWDEAPGHLPVNQILRACLPNFDPRRVVAQVTIEHFRAAAAAARKSGQ